MAVFSPTSPDHTHTLKEFQDWMKQHWTDDVKNWGTPDTTTAWDDSRRAQAWRGFTALTCKVKQLDVFGTKCNAVVKQELTQNLEDQLKSGDAAGYDITVTGVTTFLSGVQNLKKNVPAAVTGSESKVLDPATFKAVQDEVAKYTARINKESANQDYALTKRLRKLLDVLTQIAGARPDAVAVRIQQALAKHAPADEDKPISIKDFIPTIQNLLSSDTWNTSLHSVEATWTGGSSGKSKKQAAWDLVDGFFTTHVPAVTDGSIGEYFSAIPAWISSFYPSSFFNADNKLTTGGYIGAVLTSPLALIGSTAVSIFDLFTKPFRTGASIVRTSVAAAANPGKKGELLLEEY